jgi:hypothetical protein
MPQIRETRFIHPATCRQMRNAAKETVNTQNVYLALNRCYLTLTLVTNLAHYLLITTFFSTYIVTQATQVSIFFSDKKNCLLWSKNSGKKKALV